MLLKLQPFPQISGIGFKIYYFGSEKRNSIPPESMFRTDISPLCKMIAFFTIESFNMSAHILGAALLQST